MAVDLAALTDAELDQLRVGIIAEQEKRMLLRTAPQQAEQLARRVLAAEGVQQGEPWRQPAGAHDAYPLGWVVIHDGHEFESLVPANVWEPGVGPVAYTLWRDLTEAIPDGEWDPNGHTYAVGDEVLFEGARYRCLQTHESQPGWSPTAVPALWQPVDAA